MPYAKINSAIQEIYMRFKNVFFITGTAYAGKSTMVKELAKKYSCIACEENYHDDYSGELDAQELMERIDVEFK